MKKKGVKKKDSIKKLVGKVCLFRTYSAGIHYGTLLEKDGQDCLLMNAKRIWYWSGACSISQIAMEGSKDISNCKIAVMVDSILLSQVIEIIPMTKSAIHNLDSGVVWKK